MSKKSEVKIVNVGCKHLQAKVRVIEDYLLSYKQLYCVNCDTVLRSEAKVDIEPDLDKGGDDL